MLDAARTHALGRCATCWRERRSHECANVMRGSGTLHKGTSVASMERLSSKALTLKRHLEHLSPHRELPSDVQSRCRCGNSVSSPGADVAAVSPVPVQMCERRAQSRFSRLELIAHIGPSMNNAAPTHPHPIRPQPGADGPTLPNRRLLAGGVELKRRENGGARLLFPPLLVERPTAPRVRSQLLNLIWKGLHSRLLCYWNFHSYRASPGQGGSRRRAGV